MPRSGIGWGTRERHWRGNAIRLIACCAHAPQRIGWGAPKRQGHAIVRRMTP
jgi:hypothetical protein